MVTFSAFVFCCDVVALQCNLYTGCTDLAADMTTLVV